jgi:hypothetical protein
MTRKSFTTRKDRIDFDIDEEVFYLKPNVAAGQMFEVSSLQGKLMDDAGKVNSNAGTALMKELSVIFEPESFARFEKRFWGEYGPIDIGTFNEILVWIYGEAMGKDLTPKP